jgi:hypothetical protein
LHQFFLVRLEVLTAVAMKIVVHWCVTSCNLVDRPQRLGVGEVKHYLTPFGECETYGRYLEQCDAISALRREGIRGRRVTAALILTLGS